MSFSIETSSMLLLKLSVASAFDDDIGSPWKREDSPADVLTG